jgi:DNA-binding transcriptional LysR family regulator
MDRRVELHHLRYFVAVAEELHFGRAAARLGMAQPPLSQQIRRLEALVGVRLFARTSRRVVLTDAGRAFLESVRIAIAQLDRGVESARLVDRGELGTLAVGYVATSALSVLPAIVREFTRRHPAVRLHLHELSTAPQLAALRAGTIDVAFVREPELLGEVAVGTRWREPFVAALPQAHRLARLKQIQVSALAGEQFILFPRALAPRFHTQIVQICERAGFQPQVVQEALSWQTILSLVGAGLGVSLAPASTRALPLRGVRYLALTPAQPPTELCLCYRQDGASGVTSAFIEVARRQSLA